MKFLFASLFLFVPSLAWASFPDVPSTHIHATAINYVQSQGIVSGYPDGTFGPENTINRAEFTKILIGAQFATEVTDNCDISTVALTDISGDAWFAPYVCVAQAEGIIGGYPDGTFQGGNTVNFAEAAKIVTQTFNLAVDSTTTGEWYAPYISAIEAVGAMPRGGMMASDALTRGEMAAMVYAVMEEETDNTQATNNGTEDLDEELEELEILFGEEEDFDAFLDWIFDEEDGVDGGVDDVLSDL